MVKRILCSRPAKMWIDGKIFQIHNLNKVDKKTKKKEISGKEVPQDEDTYLQLLDVKKNDGQYTTSFQLPPLYYVKLKTLPNFSLGKLSEETSTKINIPKSGQSGEIVFQSDDSTGLINAVQHIHSAVAEIREKTAPIHFLCIPCHNKTVQDRFINLKNEIISMGNEITGFHESVFMNPLKLHLTIDVFALLNEEEKTEAIKALQDYRQILETVLERTGPLKLHIAGLSHMNNNVKKVDVLYANVNLENETEEHNLQRIVNDISKHFYDRGLAKKYQENVKIHMTIINTKYRKNTDSPKRKKQRQSIDATKIMEKFGQYNFGLCSLNSVQLSYIAITGEDGFYKPLAVLSLNKNGE